MKWIYWTIIIGFVVAIFAAPLVLADEMQDETCPTPPVLNCKPGVKRSVAQNYLCFMKSRSRMGQFERWAAQEKKTVEVRSLQAVVICRMPVLGMVNPDGTNALVKEFPCSPNAYQPQQPQPKAQERSIDVSQPPANHK